VRGIAFPIKRLSLCALGTAGLLLGSSFSLVAHGEAGGAGAKADSVGKSSGVSFFTKKTRLWQGRSQIICFQVSQPATGDRYYPFQVDEKLVHLLIPPRILKGEKIGYLRVEALDAGKTQIGVEGARLDIEIVPDAATQTMAELKPQIVTPASGADVWGEFAVGVEQLSLGDPTQLPTPALRLSNGKEITGHAVPDQKPSPHARWVFTVNSDDLAPGPNKLTAFQKDATGKEIEGNSIYVNAIKPDAAGMLSGLCKDTNSGDRPTYAGPRVPSLHDDEKYGQASVIDDGADGTPWCLPVWITKKGDYQMFLTARGDFGGDALATVALVLDDEYQGQTTVRLATTEWQRIPVGHPITLDEGGHMLSIHVRNAFLQGREDARTLFLQKYEFAPVAPTESRLATSAGAGSSMMSKVAASHETPSAEGSSMMSMVAASHETSPTGGSSVMSMVAAGHETPPAAGSMMSMAAMNRAGGVGSDDLHVVFTDNIDGQMLAGTVDLDAQCWWPGRDHSPPPRVELFVNKKLVASQTSIHPHFTISPAAFALGSNLLEMRAVLPTGEWANSVPLRIEVPQDFPLPKGPFRPSVVFTTYDSGLSSTMVPPQHLGDPEFASFFADGESTIKLPDDLAGNYKVVIEARGDAFQGPPQMSVGLKSEGKDTKLGEVPVGPKLGSVSVGQVALVSGSKELAVGFTNDLCQPGKGDRNLFVKAVHLVPVDAASDAIPPRVSIVVSPKTISLGSIDAVVARVMDSRRVAGADLLIDGQPQHLDQTPLHGLGSIIFPVLTRNLKPGHHQLKVVAHDEAGILGSSPEIPITVSASASTTPNKYERALFLLNRFGYGPEPAEVAAILTMGERNWLESRLAQNVDSPGEENEEASVNAQFPNSRDGNNVSYRAIQYLLTEPNPVRARFVMWAENHFSTWLNKDGPSPKAREHASFVRLGPVPFFDLLVTSATSPAMVLYLDQRNSFSHRLNENYAREVMELHTLGVNGGYTQKDVTTLADILTGWTVNDEAPFDGAGGELDRYFGYDPHLNSGAACEVLGLEFPGVQPENRFDRTLMAFELLSAHPSCATFISRKLCEQYVSDPAPPKLVSNLAQVYLETGGDIPAMLLAMSQHPDFWAARGKMANPIDYGVRTARMTRSATPGPVNELISSSGMGMFDRETPDGYPEDNGYSANSNALLQRWRFAKTMQNQILAAGLIPNSLRPADTGWNSDVTQHIVDLAAVRMTGNVLSEASNDAAQKLLDDAPPNTDIRLHALASFICQLPETSLK
jgi:uncharacterized protein (DUF1800 family)